MANFENAGNEWKMNRNLRMKMQKMMKMCSHAEKKTGDTKKNKKKKKRQYLVVKVARSEEVVDRVLYKCLPRSINDIRSARVHIRTCTYVLRKQVHGKYLV